MTEKFERTYGVWCEVWGGHTGNRAAWLKWNGVPQEFATLAEAEAEAQKMTDGLSNSGQARFRYSARVMADVRDRWIGTASGRPRGSTS
jgi:hypothetical protein